MKRDILLLAVCLCVLAVVNWLGGQKAEPVSVAVGLDEKQTLILDAGHGGEDGGASTAAGERESDINLAIVLKARALMVFLGEEPRLTRDKDISLHNNGAETIRQKKVSDLKNRVALVESIPNALLISVHQNYFTDPRYSGSQIFFNRGDPNRLWGERAQEVFRQVLFDHISCPAILIECGFLSNGEEAALLSTAAYQKKVAVALAGAYYAQFE